MESNLIKVPFDLEIAKRITNGEINGKIVTRTGDNVRIICFDWESTDEELPIIGLARNNKYELMHFYNRIGYTNKDGLESKFDLFLEIPEYMTFKDGDIIYCEVNNGGGDFCKWISIVKETYCLLGKPYLKSYVDYNFDSSFHAGELDFEYSSDNIDFLRKATEQERQELIEALKASKEPKAKECLRMLGIEEKPECEFKPFDKVLVRDDKEHDWNADLFSHINKLGYFVCLGSSWVYCIPYNDQTKHLLGTTDNWEG